MTKQGKRADREWKKLSNDFGMPVHKARGRVAKQPPQLKKRPKATPCKLTGCKRPARTLGLCVSHYGQKRRGVKLTALRGPHGRSAGLPELEGSVAVYSRVTGEKAKVLVRYAKAHSLSMYQLGSLLLGQWAEAHAAKKPVFKPHVAAKFWGRHA